jgi:diguanylate cyclase (GGDEF)-like protein/PAS domain S-box-containing protein
MQYSAKVAINLIEQSTAEVSDGGRQDALLFGISGAVILVLVLIVLIPYILKYKNLISTVKEDAARIHAMMDTSQDALIQMDSLGKIIGWSTQAEQIFGWNDKAAIGQNLSNLLIPPEFRNAHIRGLKHFLATSEGPILNKIIEVQALHKKGHLFPIELTISFISVSDGFQFSALIRDISERKQAEKDKDKRANELIIANEEKDKRAKELFIVNQNLSHKNQENEHLLDELKRAASVFTSAHESIMITNADSVIVEVNDAFNRIAGYETAEVLGKKPAFLQSGRHSKEFFTQIWEAVLTNGHWRGEIWKRRKTGEVYPEMTTISAVRDINGNLQHCVSLGTDITEIKTYQRQLEQIAHYDILTNLPNRVLLADRLNQAMLNCKRSNLSLAVVFMDLDCFKEVNDNYGHDAGDELLVTVAQRMRTALRENDTLARIGGDEFIALMINLEKPEDSSPLLQRLLKAAAEPFNIGDISLCVSASIGVSFYPADSADADQLIRQADQAMYGAKQEGKNRYRLFDTALANAVKTKLENIGDVRSGLDKNEFVLHYQPKVNMCTGKVIGAEALIRWQHPERGLVPPLDFLPAIEAHAISLDLGEWVIRTALAQVSQWQEKGINLPVSVNISAYQLQQDNFKTRLEALLSAYPEVNPHSLEFEILETSALQDISKVSATISKCHELGISFSLDDFGTGYSSLTYLRRLPVQLIKIDQSFVRDMLEDADDLAIVKGIIGLASAFQREAIAEGVETISHGIALLNLGCKLGQGYGIARPMPANDIPEWFFKWKAEDSWQMEIDETRT